MKLKIVLSLGVILFVIGCSDNGTHYGSKATKIESPDTTKAPVETRKANSGYRPAHNGQTRVTGVATQTQYKVDKIATGIGRPWAVIALPDNRYLQAHP